MKAGIRKLIAVFIVVGEVASIGGATTASAQSATPTQRQIARQQRLIRQQQRQIKDYQRQLAAQQQQPAAQGDPLGGLFGGGLILGCPRGYVYSWFGKGCYPNLPTPIVVTNPRY